MNYILKPLEGVCWKNKNGKEEWIRFGDSQKRIAEVFGAPEDTSGNTLMYRKNQLQFTFNEQGAVEFIDFLRGSDDTIHPVIFGLDVFNTDADKVIAALEENSCAMEEDCLQYTFFDLSINLMRGGKAGDLENFITELEEDCIDPESEFGKEQIAREEEQIHFCQCIGLGTKGYYNKSL